MMILAFVFSTEDLLFVMHLSSFTLAILKKRKIHKSTLKALEKKCCSDLKTTLDISQGFHLAYHSFLHIAPSWNKYKISQGLEGTH